MSASDSPGAGAWHAATAVGDRLATAATWAADHSILIAFLLVIPAVTGGVVHQVLTRRALALRTRFTLTPTRRFDPTEEDIWRQTALLLRAAGKGPWWAPRATRRVRIRLRADGSVPLEYSIEAPAAARTLLAGSRFQDVTVAEAPEAADPVAKQAAQDRRDKKDKELQQQRKAEAKARKAAAKKARQAKGEQDGAEVPVPEPDGRLHAVRAEFVLRGRPAAALREVPLDPDPLQPLIDAVADIQTDLGELAEVLLDIQAIPAWQLRLRRWQLMHEAREKNRITARKTARRAAADAAEVQDSLRHQLLSLLDPSAKAPTPMLPTPRPRAVDPADALGRLHAGHGLVRIQFLVRCASEREGRARQLLEKVSAALDVYGEDSRLGVDGGRILKWSWGADSRHRRGAFDRRWASGHVAPRKQNWVHVGELAGLLKPPTVHAVLPVLASELPAYEVGSALVPHGHLATLDGHSRLVATKAEEFLFSIAVGKSTYGKTEMALVRALALAHSGAGVLFVDPHGDSWTAAAPYLAHPALAGRVRRIDLARAEQPGAVLPCWNPLSLEGGAAAQRVVTAAVDALATALAWTDSAAPRAMTILTKACEALVHYNECALRAGRPGAQATLLQVRRLLSDKQWRDALVFLLPEDQQRWWTTTFAGYNTAEVIGPVVNPLERLATNPVTRAFLGSPSGAYDIRTAMDRGKIVWLCLEGTGPSDRLLVSMILQDLLRAGLSRRELPESSRRPFHVFADELISLDPAGGPTIAAITEQLRKFGGRLHVMAQLLNRISPTTRESVMQNSSVVSTASGSAAASRAMAEEWNGAVSAARIAELPRFHHYMQVTADGNRIGPLLVKGPQVSEAFKEHRAKPDQVARMIKRADRAMNAQELEHLLAVARGQDEKIQALTTELCDEKAKADATDGITREPQATDGGSQTDESVGLGKAAGRAQPATVGAAGTGSEAVGGSGGPSRR
ncbi:type IV secretory system conjugative DNA transfer family protein [Kitasatospora sp. NPDC059571]|uniref:type IV secretory system conjugative DNA transfer family protein n=1 Tax=Kitasatospora sp. NPDC059571 TaxID=3346871 RepID=UPI0036CAC5FD